MIKLLHDLVLIEKNQEPKSKGGILLPEYHKEKYTEGTVVAVGQGKLGKGGNYIPLGVKIGDVVRFLEWRAQDITIEDRDYAMLEEEHILVVKAQPCAC